MRSIRNCNVAVVGGAGFLGSHLVNHLIEDRGCRVLVIDNLEAGRREFVHPKAIFHWHDLEGSEDHLCKVFCDMKNGAYDPANWGKSHYSYDVPFYVFNYSARPYVPDSYERPLRTFDVNAMGAMKVINAAMEAGCDGVLQVSSAELYGDAGQTSATGYDYRGTDHGDKVRGIKIAEDAPIVPHSTYGAAKAAIDAWIQVRWKEAKTRCIALRQFNCVGERETHPYIVPEIIGQLSKQKDMFMDGSAIVRLGNNSARDFLYAGDAVRIAVELLERGSFGECYNLGSESCIKMYDLAVMIGKLMGFVDVRVELDEARVRPWEIWHLQSDNSKINALRDCKHGHCAESPSLIHLEEALKRIIAYYEANGRKWCWE